MGVGYYWVGQAAIDEHEPRIVLPEAVIDAEAAAVGKPLFWAYSPDENAACISRLHDRFNTDVGYDYLGDSRVTDTRATEIPAAVRDAVPGFDHGNQLHFVLSDALADDRIALVLPQSTS